jgi:flavin reductase (DIM6/NTAB) family NADH-FMN oxidoreductase RutF
MVQTLNGVDMEKVSIGPRPYITPMPAVLVGANVGGRPNYMTVAWTGVACMDPPMIAVAINKTRYTEKGILENKTFSVNIPASKNAVETDHCGLVSGNKVDKSKFFETFYGKVKTAPMISDFPVNIECELRHTLELGSHNLHVGEIVDIQVAEECMTGGTPDIDKIDPIVFSGQNYCHIGEIIGKAFSIGKGFKK